MKNLEQFRAAHALNFWGNNRPEKFKEDRLNEVLRSLGVMIFNQGLLATVAFAKDQSTTDHRGCQEEIMLEIGRFMASKERALLPFAVTTLDDFARGLANHPSVLLQQATAEAIVYLGYLKRFQPK